MGYLILALCIVATPADAGPVIAAFFTGLGISGTASAGAALAAGVFGGAAAFAYSAGLFLTSTIGSVLLNAGIAALSGKSRTPTPTVEDAKINVLLDVQSRWQMGGTAAVGGAVGIFAEFENSGVLVSSASPWATMYQNTPEFSNSANIPTAPPTAAMPPICQRD